MPHRRFHFLAAASARQPPQVAQPIRCHFSRTDFAAHARFRGLLIMIFRGYLVSLQRFHRFVIGYSAGRRRRWLYHAFLPPPPTRDVPAINTTLAHFAASLLDYIFDLRARGAARTYRYRRIPCPRVARCTRPPAISIAISIYR